MTESRHPCGGSSLESFLEEEGILEEVTAVAIKEVIAWQIQEAMKARKLSKARMAALMHTSRAQLDRLLDPARGNVTLGRCSGPRRCLGVN
jgi:antitoxin HicB